MKIEEKGGMTAERKQLTADEIVMQMIELAEKNYNCSQIMMMNEILTSNNMF